MPSLAFKNKSTRSSPALRYRNSVICDHLASQYVAGVLTPRVRSRLEELLSSTPELNRAVAFWADKMAEVHLQMPEQSPNKDIWSRVDALTPTEAASVKTGSSKTLSWWKNLQLWQTTGAAGILTSLTLAFFLFFTPGHNIETRFSTPNYMAAMAAHDDKSDTIHFVINAYKKTKNNPSTLFVQWSKENKRQHTERLFLWAEDKDTGKLTYIGHEPIKGEPWHLANTTWKAVANSSRLFVTHDKQQPNNKNTVFSGPCIQLGEWGKQAT